MQVTLPNGATVTGDLVVRLDSKGAMTIREFKSRVRKVPAHDKATQEPTPIQEPVGKPIEEKPQEVDPKQETEQWIDATNDRGSACKVLYADGKPVFKEGKLQVRFEYYPDRIYKYPRLKIKLPQLISNADLHKGMAAAIRGNQLALPKKVNVSVVDFNGRDVDKEGTLIPSWQAMA